MKTLKKTLALVLAIVMILALSTAAFADDPITLTITNPTANHTYKVYQLLKGDPSDGGTVDYADAGLDTLANISGGQNLKNASTTDPVADKAAVDALIDALTAKDTDGKWVLSEVEMAKTGYGFVDGTAIASKKAIEANLEADGSIKFELENGYYIIVDEAADPVATPDAVSLYMLTVVGNTTVTSKVTIPDIDKDIVDTDANAAIDTDKKVDTASIGDTINFEVTGTVPDTSKYTYYYYVVEDTMSEGLTLDDTSFVVKIGDKTLTKGTDYTVTVTGQSFKLAMKDLKAMVDNTTDYAAVVKDAAISIKYNAVVNEKAAIGTTANTNTAKLVYSNNPNVAPESDTDGIPDDDTVVGKGPDKQTKTYVTELTIVKTDDQGMPLKGAEFTLTGTNLNKVAIETATTFEAVTAGTGDYYKLVGDPATYTKTAPTEQTKDSYVGGLGATKDYVLKTITKATTTPVDAANAKATTDADGVITFVGLNAGTYTIKETKTPVGYNTIDPIEVEISASGDITWATDKGSVLSGTVVEEIVNTAGTVLPSTGGIGTTIFYIAGAILLIGAGVLLITKKRVGEEE